MNTMTDPLAVFMAGVWARSGAHPLPLLSTELDIAVQAGMATVTTRRKFRNAEAEAIEAVMTFPVPVNGALFSLTAEIDGRLVKAQAQRKETAREVYEDAIERGKAAVLHEEVLRGVHMLSVANLRPGGEIEVTTRWVAALSLLGQGGHLRIPMTVGDVYGTSGLAASDELTHEARPGQMAMVRLSKGVAIMGAAVVDGVAEVPMNRPIDVTAPAWTHEPLYGRAGDGRRVELTIAPAPIGEKHVHLAVLVDCSGSMNEVLDPGRPGVNKHQAAAGMVRALAASLSKGDAFDIWEFNMNAREVGRLKSFAAKDIDAALNGLSAPGNGTEIGRSIAQVAKGSEAGDILLITDGKSYALDVQALAQLGRRISVLLIGEDSLEARVGHLAALTGGELFIATAGNLAAVAGALVAAVRLPYTPVAAMAAEPEQVRIHRGGVEITAQWSAAEAPETPETNDPAVSALAASLALPGMTEDRAAAFAEAEGLVTHLTSLVLVDEVGEAQEGLPASRKIALESPMHFMGGMAMPVAAASPAYAPPPGLMEERMRSAPRAMAMAPQPLPPMAQAPAKSSGGVMDMLGRIFFGPSSPSSPAPTAMPERARTTDLASLASDLARLGSAVDWDASPTQLLAGDYSRLLAVPRKLLEKLAKLMPKLAGFEGLDDETVVMALTALMVAASNRTAERFAKRALDGIDPAAVEAVKRILKVA